MQATHSIIDPQTRRWTKDEFHQMADLGWFQDQRAELIDGEIVVLSPQKFPHGSITDGIAQILRDAFGPTFWVRSQLPLDLGETSEPEPDVSVVKGPRLNHKNHPATAVLVVEVSDTTIVFDRRQKARLYASAQISDYWIADLVHSQLIVHRDPVGGSTPSEAFRYAKVVSLSKDQIVSPLSAPSAQIKVADLLEC
jgi:Uma2 family endonuclease